MKLTNIHVKVHLNPLRSGCTNVTLILSET